MSPIPKWGRVTAQANEFLIQMRDGKVGVEVKGLAVYRIAEPLVAFRMIELDRTSLTDVLREMFVGATRRIVAGLGLDECMTHRKDRVAAELMREIAPILAGEGAPSDTNAAGWGVVLDTIEIQDVRVLSQEVFGRLQAPYREKLARRGTSRARAPGGGARPSASQGGGRSRARRNRERREARGRGARVRADARGPRGARRSERSAPARDHAHEDDARGRARVPGLGELLAFLTAGLDQVLSLDRVSKR